MTHVQNPPIFEELWRNHVATEIQTNPQRYILGQGIDAEAKAIAAGELARLDFEDESDPDPETETDEPIAAEAKWDETARRDKVAALVVLIALGIFFGFIGWAVVVISA